MRGRVQLTGLFSSSTRGFRLGEMFKATWHRHVRAISMKHNGLLFCYDTDRRDRNISNLFRNV